MLWPQLLAITSLNCVCVFCFQGKQGEQGPKGDPGPYGLKGAKVRYEQKKKACAVENFKSLLGVCDKTPLAFFREILEKMVNQEGLETMAH